MQRPARLFTALRQLGLVQLCPGLPRGTAWHIAISVSSELSGSIRTASDEKQNPWVFSSSISTTQSYNDDMGVSMFNLSVISSMATGQTISRRILWLYKCCCCCEMCSAVNRNSRVLQANIGEFQGFHGTEPLERIVYVLMPRPGKSHILCPVLHGG